MIWLIIVQKRTIHRWYSETQVAYNDLSFRKMIKITQNFLGFMMGLLMNKNN